MNRLIALLLCTALMITGCVSQPEHQSAPSTSSIDTADNQNTPVEPVDNPEPSTPTLEPIAFDGLADPDLLQFVEDSVYASLAEELQSDDYVIEQVVAVHVSKEYLEELNYNSQENIYFGYKLSDVESQFQGTKYVFDVNGEGVTEVREFAAYDDTFDQVLKNVAIGSGVILVCVVVSAVAGSTAIPAGAAISSVFAASAKTGTTFAVGSGLIGAVTSGIITGIETGDLKSSLKSAAVSGAEGFKWGALSGVVTGGVSQAIAIKKPATTAIPAHKESEVAALKKYGGEEQKSYLAGQERTYGTLGSTRPDLVRTVRGKLEAIEVKNYDLKANMPQLVTTLKDQVAQRVRDLPPGTRQRIVLDVRGRGYTAKELREYSARLKAELRSIDPKIIIDFMR